MAVRPMRVPIVWLCAISGVFGLAVTRPAEASASAASKRAVVRIAGDAPVALARGILRPASTRFGQRQLLTITVVLRRTDQAGFDRYLAQVYDPASPQYRHFLTQAQLADRFGPSAAEYHRVSAWLASEGFTVIERSGNRLSLTVRGTRARAERAFDTPIRDYRVGKRAVYANVRAPALPRSISSDVAAVIGLSDTSQPAAPAPHYVKVTNQCTNGVCTVSVTACVNGRCFSETETVNLQQQFGDCLKVIKDAAKYLFATKALPAALAATLLNAIACNVPWGLMSTGAGCLNAGKPPRGIAPCPPGAAADVRRLARRGSPALRSRTPGQWPKIGLLEFDTFNPSDVGDWLSAVGFDSTSQLGRLSEVPVGGGVAAPGSGEGEVLLDIDTVLADTAPTNAPVVVYDAPSNTSFVQMFQTMVGDGDTVISNSWAQCEDQTPIAEAKAIDSVLASAAASGVSVLNGAGDTGSTCLDGSANTVAVPADSPNATAVGGSTVIPGPGGTYGSENWWDGSGDTPSTGQGGFGVSSYFASPAYQRGLSSAAGRSVPDVVAPANPIMGPEICQADAGGCPDNLQWGGTSMAAPEWASIVADLDSQLGEDVGNVNAALYPLANTSAFHTAADLSSDFAHVGLGDANYPRLLGALAHYAPQTVDPGVSVATATGTSGPDNADVPADGSTAGTVVVDLRDANGFPISGKSVTVTPQAGSSAVVSPSSANTDATAGAAVFKVSDTTPQTVTFTVRDAGDGVTLAEQPTITFVTPTATGASIVASPPTVVDDGSSQATITVYLENGLGRPAGGKTVSLSDNGTNARISPASAHAVTDPNGLATFTVTDTANETVWFTATDVSDGNLPVPGSTTVVFAPPGPPNCAQTLPTGTGGVSVSPFATALGTNQQPVVTNGGGLTFTTPACDGAETPVFDSGGNVYVPDDIDGHIYRFTPGGGTASASTALPDTSFAPNGQLDAIAFGTNGELWATTNNTGGDNRQPELLQLDPQTGATQRVVATHADGLDYCPQYNVAVDPLTGDVFTGDDCGGSLSSNAITRVHAPDGTSPTVSTYTTEGGPVVGMAFAPDGTMYVVRCTNSACSEIDSVSGTNGPATPVITTIANLAQSAVGLAVASSDSQGHATALEASGNGGDIYRIDLTQHPAVVTTIATGNGPSGSAENAPVGVGHDGCLYVARADTVFKVAGPSCSQASAGPEITVTENGSPTPPTGSPVTLTATLHNFSNPAGTRVDFAISGPNPGIELAHADGAGQATVSYAGVFPGVDTITATADAGGGTVTSVPVSVHWTSGKSTTFLDLNPTQPGGIAGHTATVSAQLLDVTQNPPAPIAGMTVALALGSSVCDATTNAAGVASCALTPQTVGLLPVTASYGGDSGHTAAASSDEFDSFKAVPPQVTQFKVTPGKFRAAKRGPSLPRADIAAKHKRAMPPTGTTISYVDSLPASTTLTIQKAVAGVRKANRCVAPPRRHRRGKRLRSCVRYVVVARIVHLDRAGKVPASVPGVRQGNRCVAPPAHRRHGRHKPKPKHCTRVVQIPTTIVFDGRVRGRALTPGRYRVQAVATIDGLRSTPVTTRFTIVR